MPTRVTGHFRNHNKENDETPHPPLFATKWTGSLKG